MRALSHSLARSLSRLALSALLFLSACAATSYDDETSHDGRRPSGSRCA